LNSAFGLGIEAKICTLLVPGDAAGYTGIEAIIPREINNEGVTVTPEFDYSFGNFTYIKCEFAGIGVDDGDVSFTPALLGRKKITHCRVKFQTIRLRRIVRRVYFFPVPQAVP